MIDFAHSPEDRADVLVRCSHPTLGFALGLLLVLGCESPQAGAGEGPSIPMDTPWLVVLGIAQDGGFPQAGTEPGPAWDPDRRRYATSLAVVDPLSGERWLFEATPDFRDQLHELDRLAPAEGTPGLSGIFLTHAHVEPLGPARTPAEHRDPDAGARHRRTVERADLGHPAPGSPPGRVFGDGGVPDRGTQPVGLLFAGH